MSNTHGRHGRVVALAAAMTVAAAAPAAAQIPGSDPTAKVVVADATTIKVSVSHPDVLAGTVTGSVQNDTGQDLTCSGIDGSPAVTVTEVDIVARGIDFYARYPAITDPKTTVNAPVVGAMVIDLGSVTSNLPPLVAGYMNPRYGAENTISDAYVAARLAGHVGQLATLTIPAHTVRNFTVPLGAPSSGTRTDFTAGAFFGCTIGAQSYVFAGYEGGAPPRGTVGSLQSPGTGAFGS